MPYSLRRQFPWLRLSFVNSFTMGCTKRSMSMAIILTNVLLGLCGQRITDLEPRFEEWPYNEDFMARPNEYLYHDVVVNCYFPLNSTHNLPWAALNVENLHLINVETNKPFSQSGRTMDAEFMRVSFALNATDTSTYADLRCDLGGQVGKVILTIPFLMCAENGAACQKSKPCDQDVELKYCFHTKSPEPKTCSKMPKIDWCRFEKKQHTFCPVGEVGICAATFKNSSAMWIRLDSNSTACPKYSAPIMYKNISRVYGEPLFIESPDDTITLKCPAGSPLANQKIISTQYADRKIVQVPDRVCVDEMVISLDKTLVTLKPDIFEVVMTADMKVGNSVTKMELKNWIVVLHNEVDIAVVGTNTINCSIKSPIDARNKIQLRTWLASDSEPRKELDPVERNHYEYPKGFSWSLSVQKTNDYKCYALLVYKTCSPHRRFEKLISSKSVHVEYSAGVKSFCENMAITVVQLIVCCLQ